jgi:hypothetical protein
MTVHSLISDMQTAIEGEKEKKLIEKRNVYI